MRNDDELWILEAVGWLVLTALGLAVVWFF